LNVRGNIDAAFMADVLKKENIFPDLILSSTATRAKEFAKIIAAHLNFKKEDIKLTKRLYLASEMEMIQIVNEINDNNKIVFLIGHNSGITDFANELCKYNVDNIPTSGIFGIDFELNSWNDVKFGSGKFKMFEYPKKYTI